MFHSDLAETFGQSELGNLFAQDWVLSFIKEVRQNKDFSSRTIETARWAREQVKRAISSKDSPSPIGSPDSMQNAPWISEIYDDENPRHVGVNGWNGGA